MEIWKNNNIQLEVEVCVCVAGINLFSVGHKQIEGNTIVKMSQRKI